MSKKLTILLFTVILVSICSTSFAFDFDGLEKKVQSGEITKQEASKIVDEAIKSGEITEEEAKKMELEKRKRNSRRKPKRPMRRPPR